MDGRDIGTVVFPDAGLKYSCLRCSYERHKGVMMELIAKGDEVTYETVLKC
jgi:cytidylate kinase